MPILLPDPQEVANMDWHARDKALRRARRLLEGYGDMVLPADAERWRLSAEGKRIAHADWAAGVREEARILLHDLGPDPAAGEHSAVAVAALYEVAT